MLNITFHGASGPVSFGRENVKGRNPGDIMLGLYNIHPKPVKKETGKRSYTAVLASTYLEERGWKDVSGAKLLFRDGSSTAPGVFRKYFNENYISSSVRAVGLILMSIAWLLALMSIVLVGWLRKDPIVQRAQPFFMQILCFGSIIMSAAIFTLSFDEGAGWTDKQLDIACTLFPWFFFTGQIMMFCALFTKLWRLDRVLQFRRRAVTARSALTPLLAFLAITLSILVAYTIVDPWLWQREVISELPAETYGQCTSNHTWAFFGPLGGILFTAELLTMYFAWKTSDVPEDFRDSGSVMYACFAQLQAWAIGGPMLALLGVSSADATYFGRVFLVWVFAVSGVVVVVGPKIVKAIKIRLNPELVPKPGRRVSVTGLYPPSANSLLDSSDHFDSLASSFNSSFPKPKKAPALPPEKHLLEIPEIEDPSASSTGRDHTM
jgi:hypothetical protein